MDVKFITARWVTYQQCPLDGPHYFSVNGTMCQSIHGAFCLVRIRVLTSEFYHISVFSLYILCKGHGDTMFAPLSALDISLWKIFSRFDHVTLFVACAMYLLTVYVFCKICIWYLYIIVCTQFRGDNVPEHMHICTAMHILE